ncbi:hypothetical protein ACE7GA_22305 [Roseomonas sp. CCTCC AB2023176]|uniref:hypothetical protein n=1 Tax=Roseomonas sp. CCTCC AB2023176 TaxID=3342640 RepID=UPI0035E14B99
MSAVTKPLAALQDDWAGARGDARLLADIALAAAQAGLADRARPIVALLERMEPDHPIAAVTRAVAAMAANRPADAVDTLRREAIGRPRGQDAAHGILLVALVAAGQSEEARRLADEVLAGPDTPARRMAATLRPALGPASPSGPGAASAVPARSGAATAAPPFRGVR